MQKLQFELSLFDSPYFNKTTFNETNLVRVIPTRILDLVQDSLYTKEETCMQHICTFLDWLVEQCDQQKSSTIEISQSDFIFSSSKYYYDFLKKLMIKSGVIHIVENDKLINSDYKYYDYKQGVACKYKVSIDLLSSHELTLLLFPLPKTKMTYTIKYKVNPIMEETILTEEMDYFKLLNVFMNQYMNGGEIQEVYLKLTRALKLKNHRYIKKGSNSDRVYHSLFNIDKESRKCYKTKYYNIDIKNCQPILLIILMNRSGVDVDPNYIQACESGEFYELFYDLIDVKYKDVRQQTKRRIYRDIFFGFNTNSIINKRFYDLYPTVWEYLNYYFQMSKTGEWNKLAGSLQNIEAEIFLNIKVKHSTRMYTLFDAIYFNNKKDMVGFTNHIMNYAKKNNVKLKITQE